MSRESSDPWPSTFRLRRRTPGSFLLVPCPRIGRSIRCQGRLEAAAAMVLAACPVVASVREQPFAIWYLWRETPHGVEFHLLDGPPRRRRIGDARVAHVVPDFLVELVDGRWRLLEVKPSSKLDRADVRRKLAVARSYAARSGWTYHVVTERQLHWGPLLANVRLLARYRNARIDDGLRRELLAAVVGPIPIGQLVESGSADPSTRRVAVLHLVATWELDCDPCNKSLSDPSVLVQPGGTRPWDPFDSVWAPSGCSTDAPSGWSARPPPTPSLPST